MMSAVNSEDGTSDGTSSLQPPGGRRYDIPPKITRPKPKLDTATLESP